LGVHFIAASISRKGNPGGITPWNNTDYGNDFNLVIVTGKAGTTIPALKPKKNKNGFKWILRGETGISELEELILDYAKQLKYNMGR